MKIAHFTTRRRIPLTIDDLEVYEKKKKMKKIMAHCGKCRTWLIQNGSFRKYDVYFIETCFVQT